MTRDFRNGVLVANFFLDNEDIRFLFDHIDLAELARIQEDDFVHAGNGDADYAPVGRGRRRRQLSPHAGDHRRGGRRHDRPECRTDRPRRATRSTKTARSRCTRLVQQNLKRLAQADADGLHPAAQIRRPELPQPGLHHGHRDYQPGRHLADEHFRPAGHRRNNQRLRQRQNQG